MNQSGGPAPSHSRHHRTTGHRKVMSERVIAQKRFIYKIIRILQPEDRVFTSHQYHVETRHTSRRAGCTFTFANIRVVADVIEPRLTSHQRVPRCLAVAQPLLVRGRAHFVVGAISLTSSAEQEARHALVHVVGLDAKDGFPAPPTARSPAALSGRRSAPPRRAGGACRWGSSRRPGSQRCRRRAGAVDVAHHRPRYRAYCLPVSPSPFGWPSRSRGAVRPTASGWPR